MIKPASDMNRKTSAHTSARSARSSARPVFRCRPALALAIIAISVLPLLSGCVGLVLGGAAAVGLAAAQDRSIGEAADDRLTGFALRDKWTQDLGSPLMDIDITVTEGTVMLTGVVDDPDTRVDAVRTAWQVKGVKRVINEIQVAEGGGFLGYAKDQRITVELRLRLTSAKNVASVNYSIDTVGGVVYLMGIAQNRAELERVVAIARSIGGVERVVSYARLKRGK